MFGLSAQNFFFSEEWIVTTASWVPYNHEDPDLTSPGEDRIRYLCVSLHIL